MERSKQREIASKGGKAAHAKGTGHKWTSGEEAQAAGRAGGLKSAAKQAAKRKAADEAAGRI